jgi:hypothetical protein
MVFFCAFLMNPVLSLSAGTRHCGQRRFTGHHTGVCAVVALHRSQLRLTSSAQEYEFFFEMKFGKKPKLTKKTM